MNFLKLNPKEDFVGGGFTFATDCAEWQLARASQTAQDARDIAKENKYALVTPSVVAANNAVTRILL